MVGGGGTLGWALHVSKSKPLLVFLDHCISDGNQLFSENFGCHFHLILHIMSDKAVFVNRALHLCIQRYRGNLTLYHCNSASRWQRINLDIYAATNSVVLHPNVPTYTTPLKYVLFWWRKSTHFWVCSRRVGKLWDILSRHITACLRDRSVTSVTCTLSL